MTALLAMLAIAGYQNRDKIGEVLGKLNTPGPDGKPGSGGILESLGIDTKGAGLGGLLTGGLGELLDRFKQSGQSEAADSWVKTGPNKSCTQADLEKALGPDTIELLTQQTGLTKDELLSRLCKELPDAVDKYTPRGFLADQGATEGRAS